MREKINLTFNGKKIGGFGMAEAFSLHPSKVLNAGEGGAITFSSKKLAASFYEYWRERGVFSDSYELNTHNIFSIEPVNAILGLCSLDNYPKFIKHFCSQYNLYKQKISECIVDIDLISYDEHTSPNYKTILVKLGDKVFKNRKEILNTLESNLIGARPYYFPLSDLTLGNSLLSLLKPLLLSDGRNKCLSTLFCFDEEFERISLVYLSNFSLRMR